MSFRKGLKSVTQSRLERDCRYLRQYDTRCNIGLEKDDPYDRYNLVESSTSVATESSSYTSLCTENNRAVSSSSQSRSAVDRERCNKSRDRGKDHRKEETLGSAALRARMFSNKCHRSSNFPSSQYKKLNSESNEFSGKSNYLEANDENMSSVGMDTFTVENISFSQPKSFKQNKEVDKNDTLKRQKTLEFLEKLLKNCDPEIEEQLKKLVKEKFGLHMKSSHQKEVLSSNQTVNGIMEFLEQQRNDSFLPCNSSRLPSLSGRSKNDWSKLRADNNRNLIKSTKAFLSKNRVTESTPSFVLGESNLNEDSDEGAFLHGENCSENKSARNCTTSNIFETKSHKDFSNSPQHDMWDTIHQVLNEQKLENQFWQKATSIKNNFETKLPNFMDKSSTEDSTIKNILKSIGFDTEMCKRMQECAKQVSGINDQLGSDKDKQLTNKFKHSLSPEIDKCGLKRAKNKILSSEKASHKILFNKNFIATVPPIDTSVPPPVANFSNTVTPLPPPAPPPLSVLHSRPPVHSVLPSGLPTPIAPANYTHVPSQPAIAPCGPFFAQPQTSNLFPQQYNFSNMFERNTCYNTSKSIIPTTIPCPPVHSNLKVIPPSTVPTSNSSIPSATTPSSLPGSSLCRDNSPKTDSWLSNNERSSQWNLLSPSHRDRSPTTSFRNRSLTPCSSRQTSYTLRCERSQVSSSSKEDKSHSPLSSRLGRSRTPSSLRRDKSRERSLTPSKSRRKKSRNQNKQDRSRTPYSSRRSHSRSPCSLKRDRPRSVSGRGSRYSKSRHSRSPSKPCNFHSKRSKLLHPVDERFASEYEYSPSPPLQKRTAIQCNGSTEGKNNASSLKVQDVKEIFALKSKNLNASTNNSNRKYSCFLPHEIEQIIKQRILCNSRLEILQNELAMLRKQQNELMRKKQREKDGHKDPLLTENAALQEEVSNQVKLLKKTMEELTETLEISGMSMESFTYHEKFYQYSKKSSLSDQFGFKSKSHETRANEKNRKTNKFHSHEFDKTASIQKEMSCEHFSSRDNKPLLPLEIKSFAKGSQSSDKDKFSWNKRMDDSQLCEDKDKRTSSFPLKWSAYSSENFLHNLHGNKDMAADNDETRPNKAKVSYEYFDPGNHWCRHCNLVTGNIYELFHHLQSKKHKAKLDHYDRPWLPESIKNPSNKPKMGQVQMAPIKGVEFLMSTHAFYCTLCKEFSGDVLCAEAHLKSDSHNTTYQKHIQENPYYEKRLNLDKAAGLQFFTSDKGEKRKNTEDSEMEERKDSFKKIQHDSKEKFLEVNKETEASSKDLIKDTKTDSEISAEIFSEEIQKENFENNSNKKAGVSSSCENKQKNEQDETKVTVLEASSAKNKILDQAKSSVQRSKIAIKLTGKTVIKPLQYPVLPPSIPVGKMPGRHKKRSVKAGFGKKVWPVKEIENQLSLDDFLTCSNNHGSVPVVSDIETDEERTDIKITNINTSRQSADTSILQESIDNTENKKSSQKSLPESYTSTTSVSVTQMSSNCLLPIDVLATAPPPPPPPVNAYKNSSNVFGDTENSDVYTFPAVDQKSINIHELNKWSEAKIISESKKGARTLLNQQEYETQMAVSTGVSTKSEEFSAEDLDDMRLLGIDPASQVPMAEVRPPPSLLSLTAHNMTNGDHKVKSKPIKDKNCVGNSHNVSFVDNSTICEKDGKQLESECLVSFDENKEQSPDEPSQVCSETGQHTFEDKSGHDQANLQFFTSDQRQRKENNKDSDNKEKKNNCKKIQFDSKEKFLEENKVTTVLLKDLIKDTKTNSETSTEISEEIQKANFENNSDKKAGVSPVCEEKMNDTKVTVIAESFVKDKILDQAKPTIQRSKITIKLTGKTGIKPLQYPVLSPWMSTSKMPDPNNAQSAKVNSDKKMCSTKEIESQLSLDDFLTCSNNHGSDPVASDIETEEEKTNIKISNLNTCRRSADTSILQESIDNSENKKSQEFLPDSHMSTTMPVSVSQVSGSCLLPISVLATTPFPTSPPERNSSNVFEGTESSDLCISLAVDQKSSNVHESNKESETKVISESKNGARTLLSQHKGTIQVPVSTGVKFFTRDLDKRLLGVDSTSQVSMGKINHSSPSVFQITETSDASLYQTDKENITLHSSVTLEGNPSNGSPPIIQETSLLVNKEHFSKICSNNVSDPLASSTSTLFDEINSKSCYSISALHSELSSVPSKLQLSDNFELPRKNSVMVTAPSNLSAINTGEIKSDHSAISSESDAKNNCMEKKDSCSLVTLLSNSARSDMRTVDSSTVEQNISLIPLPTSMSSSLANIWDIPLPSNLQSECQPPSHGVLIRESEHNYAIRLMENSDGVLHPMKRVPLQHDDKNVDSDDSNNDISNNSWKAQSFVAQAYLSHSQSDDDGETSQLSISSENDSNNSLPQQCSQSSESNDTISPPVLEAEGRQSCLIPNEDLSNNDSPPPLTAEVPCLSPSVSLPCSTSSVIPVTLICNPPCESKTLLTTPNTLSIDNTSLLNNMSILNLDSVIRSQAKTYSSNDRNVKSIKKVVLLKKPVQNIPSRHLRTSRKSRSKQNDVKLLKVDKVDQEKIIVKVTSRTSEGVPVISLTPATSTASYTTSDLSSSSVATTSSCGSNFTEISETETADSSLLEAAAKKAETLPKMFMPTVVLHDIKYTMGKDLSPMATIPSSIENIPIFDSENDDSDSDVKFESPKKSFESQRQLEIESPSKTAETFDPYMFLNRPTKPSIPSSSYNTQLTNESSTLFSIGPCGTSATGRVTADSLPSIDNQSMISNMFDVTDCKFAFPDVFLENGEPETPPKISNVDVLGPGLPFETSSKSNIALGLDILNEFYTVEGTEDSG